MLRRFALRAAQSLLWTYRVCRQSVSVSSDGDAGRLQHVGGDDQLRRVSGIHRSPTAIVMPCAYPLTDKPWPALPCHIVCQRMSSGRQSRQGYASFPTGRACLINRYARRKTVAASGQRRAGSARAYRLSFAGVPAVFQFGGLSQRSAPSGSTGARRYRGSGRRVPAVLSCGIQPL